MMGNRNCSRWRSSSLMQGALRGRFIYSNLSVFVEMHFTVLLSYIIRLHTAVFNNYIAFFSASTSSIVGRTKSYFQIQTLPDPLLITSISESVYPSFFHSVASVAVVRSHISDFLVAKTGSVPRNGECDG